MDIEKEMKQTVMMMISFTVTGEKRRKATHTWYEKDLGGAMAKQLVVQLHTASLL
jgi:hypothetical protein